MLSKKVYNLLKSLSQTSQNYYPETLHQVYIINAGMLFKMAWAIVKNFFDPKTKSKFKILGSDYKKELLEVIDSANLPKFLGGECDCQPWGCVISDSGPWNIEGKPEFHEYLDDLESIK